MHPEFYHSGSSKPTGEDHAGMAASLILNPALSYEAINELMRQRAHCIQDATTVPLRWLPGHHERIRIRVFISAHPNQGKTDRLPVTELCIDGRMLHRHGSAECGLIT